MVDLATIVTDDRTIEITHPGDGSRIGVRVTIVSIDDDRMTKVKRRITDRRLALEVRGKHWKSEEIEENKNDLLFTAMTGWEWYNPTGGTDDSEFDESAHASFNGDENPEFNRKTVNEVFTKLPWFADQVNEAVGDTKSFFSHSKPN